MLSILYVILPSHTSRLISFHTTLVVLSILGVYIYRNVWPLLTLTLHPLDDAEGWLLWMKIGLASLAGVFLPLVEPYPYIPVDPKVSIPRFLGSSLPLKYVSGSAAGFEP